MSAVVAHTLAAPDPHPATLVGDTVVAGLRQKRQS